MYGFYHHSCTVLFDFGGVSSLCAKPKHTPENRSRLYRGGGVKFIKVSVEPYYQEERSQSP